MWRTIESAPKDQLLWLFWPRHPEDGQRTVAVGRWKENERHQGHPVYAVGYFSDCLTEWDDFDMARPGVGPTHWQPYRIPEPPGGEER
jgi:hypothetical protein